MLDAGDSIRGSHLVRWELPLQIERSACCKTEFTVRDFPELEIRFLETGKIAAALLFRFPF
jgi:hypothetical protein